VDVAQDVIINEYDCGTSDGIYVEPHHEGGVEVEPLRDRVGRPCFAREDQDFEGSVIVDVNQEITEELANQIQAAVSSASASAPCSPANRAAEFALCATDATSLPAEWSNLVKPSRHRRAVHRRTGTQLTMRTFHIGGAATRVSERSTLEAKNNGIVKFVELRHVEGRVARPSP